MKKESYLDLIDINQLLDCIQDGVFLIDENATIINMNKASANLTNVPREDMMNKNIYDLIKSGVFDEGETCSTKALESGEKVHKIQRGRQGKYDILSTATPFMVEGKTKLVIVTERDLTNIFELKSLAESEKKRAKKFETELKLYKALNEEKSEIVANSKIMRKTIKTATLVGMTDASVLIEGESGTGKEVVSKVIQENSSRKSNPFITINCSAIPESLIESELFGYEKGAFTGALNQRKLGYFELADKGTLFLDEIDTLPLHIQPKFLRVLQENEFYRIGGSKPIKIDVRIIAATNNNLYQLVLDGKFRKDLYYRLNVVPVCVPTLRERVDDIVPLAQLFLTRFNKKYATSKTITMEAFDKMKKYSWPGNVRELENYIERLVITTADDSITPEIVEKNMRLDFEETESGADKETINLKALTEEFEKNTIKKYMGEYKNSYELAKALGIDKTTLNRKIRKYGIKARYMEV